MLIIPVVSRLLLNFLEHCLLGGGRYSKVDYIKILRCVRQAILATNYGLVEPDVSIIAATAYPILEGAISLLLWGMLGGDREAHHSRHGVVRARLTDWFKVIYTLSAATTSTGSMEGAGLVYAWRTSYQRSKV